MSAVNPQEEILKFAIFLTTNSIDSRKTAYSPKPHRAGPYVSFYQQTFIFLTQNQHDISLQTSIIAEVSLKQRIQLIKSKTDGVIGFFRYLFCLSIRIDLKEEVRYLEIIKELTATIRDAAAKRPKEKIDVETPSTPPISPKPTPSTSATRKKSLQNNQALAQLAHVVMNQPPGTPLRSKKSPATPLTSRQESTTNVEKLAVVDEGQPVSPQKIATPISAPRSVSISDKKAIDLLAKAIENRILTPAISRQIVATIPESQTTETPKEAPQSASTENTQKEENAADESSTSTSAPPPPPAPPIPAAIFTSNAPPPPPMNKGKSALIVDPKTAHDNREKQRLERELKDRLSPANVQSVIPLNDEVKKEKEKQLQSLKRHLTTLIKLNKADPDDEQTKKDIQSTQEDIAQAEKELEGKKTFFNSINKKREMTQQAQKLTTEELKSLLGMYFGTVEESLHPLQEACKTTYAQAQSLIKSTVQSHKKTWVEFFSEQRGRLDIYLDILNQRLSATAKEPIYEAKAYDPQAKSRASTKLEASVKSVTSVTFDPLQILAVKLNKPKEYTKREVPTKESAKDIRGFSMTDLLGKLNHLKPASERSVRSV